MGYRDRERRDPYVRKLSEKIRKSEIAGLTALGKAIDLRHEINRKEREEELKRHFESMCKEKVSALDTISRCPSEVSKKDQWFRHLDSILLTSSGANTELKNLLEGVERERTLWSDKPLRLPGDRLSNLPEWWKGLPGVSNWLLAGSGSSQERKPPSSINAVELRLQQKEEELRLRLRQYEEEKAREKARVESHLASIESSLGSLISARNLYESTLSRF